MTDNNELDFLLQKEWREKKIPELGTEPWIRVYQHSKLEGQSRLHIDSGIVPNEYVKQALSSHSWGSHVGFFAPSYEAITDDDSEQTTLKYYRFGDDDGFEPLVIVRSFDGLKANTIEILEEFRLFHNLYFDSTNATYVRFDDSGDEIEVVRVADNFVDVKRREIRQFLTARSMSLVVYFDRMWFSNLAMEEVDKKLQDSKIKEDTFIYDFSVRKWDYFVDKDYRSCSRIIGKKIIKELPLEKSGLWPFEDKIEREYEDFIIGVNENDEPRYYTSDPDKLADFYGKNRHAPNFLTSVFFRREVLTKYYNEPSKYKVEDRVLRCGSKWMLQLDNNHGDYVIVFLGDLGGGLPHKEQTYWKSYNVPPDGHMSSTYFRQSICAEFVDPEDSALRFQLAFERLSEAWHKKFGWHLFRPLQKLDEHHFKTLRRPLNNEHTELNEIAVSLSKLLPEAIEESELLNLIKSANPRSKRSFPNKTFAVLREYLALAQYDDSRNHVDYLEKVQMLRAVVAAHRTDIKPEAYNQVRQFFELDTKSTIQVADDIFTTLTDFLDSLREHFCPDDSA